jgi:ABC-type branched-subunit amino acid transport system ATPase component
MSDVKGRSADPRDGLSVKGLHVQFGGRTAVRDLSFQVPAGSITGLIGPNGAGKTTTFNACSGLVKPSGGTVELLGRDISRMSAARRARQGLGRTFQRMELCEDLSVAQNVALGREAGLAGASPWRQVIARPRERHDVHVRTQKALEQCGLLDVASSQVGLLSTGRRRLVELARGIAAGFRVLMLDEPSSGLDTSETENFASILLRLVGESKTGIFLVEHDISLIRSVCSYIYVLDFGQLIEEGPAGQILSSSAVAAAYLGSEAAHA